MTGQVSDLEGQMIQIMPAQILAACLTYCRDLEDRLRGQEQDGRVMSLTEKVGALFQSPVSMLASPVLSATGLQQEIEILHKFRREMARAVLRHAPLHGPKTETPRHDHFYRPLNQEPPLSMSELEQKYPRDEESASGQDKRETLIDLYLAAAEANVSAVHNPAFKKLLQATDDFIKTIVERYGLQEEPSVLQRWARRRRSPAARAAFSK